MSDELVVERRVSVPPEKVFKYFTDPARWLAWQGTEAEIDLVAGGVWRVNVTGEGFASGRVVEVVENERVVFTWGWEHGPPVPPGSTTVAIELVPDGDGTLIRLTHSGLPPDEVEIHRFGWQHYAARLAAVAAGLDPGPNAPVASRRGSRTTAAFEEAVVAAIRALAPGEVASYGQIAEEAGFPGAARAVGNVLAASEGLPWWRIVRADGRLGASDQGKQARLLRREGVRVVGGRVVDPEGDRRLHAED